MADISLNLSYRISTSKGYNTEYGRLVLPVMDCTEITIAAGDRLISSTGYGWKRLGGSITASILAGYLGGATQLGGSGALKWSIPANTPIWFVDETSGATIYSGPHTYGYYQFALRSPWNPSASTTYIGTGSLHNDTISYFTYLIIEFANASIAIPFSCSNAYTGYNSYAMFECETGSFGSISLSPCWYNISSLDGLFWTVTNDNLRWSNALSQDYPVNTDPYGPGGDSGGGGGRGRFSDTGDDIDFPSLPTLSAVDAGFITIFNPSVSQMRALCSYMWGPLFDLENWKKIFANPMDAILGLSIVPVDVPAGDSKNVKVGNIDTDVSLTTAARQYVEVDCGSLSVEEYWGAYLDFDPYTKAEIYLPYIGTHALAVDDIMGKTVHVKYHVDILSGACCAYIKCGGSVMYSFAGQCSCSVPISANDWTNVVNSAITIAASIGTMVATKGAAAPMIAGGASIASAAVNMVKPEVEKSGAMGGMGGMLGIQTPYLILTRPRQAVPSRQNAFMGYPAFITKKLDDLEGYTEIEHIHLTGIPASADELNEIEAILKTGVIF